MKFLMTRSRIYTSEMDERYYRSNVLYDAMLALAVQARSYGTFAREDIQRCYEATTVEDAHFFAYFSGVNARKAFTIAALILDLAEKRPLNHQIDWRKW